MVTCVPVRCSRQDYATVGRPRRIAVRPRRDWHDCSETDEQGSPI